MSVELMIAALDDAKKKGWNEPLRSCVVNDENQCPIGVRYYFTKNIQDSIDELIRGE